MGQSLRVEATIAALHNDSGARSELHQRGRIGVDDRDTEREGVQHGHAEPFFQIRVGEDRRLLHDDCQIGIREEPETTDASMVKTSFSGRCDEGAVIYGGSDNQQRFVTSEVRHCPDQLLDALTRLKPADGQDVA